MTDNSPPQEPDGSPEQPRMDPEQWRQFQEFQRFQEYLRYTQARGSSQGTELAQWTPPQVPVPDQPRSPVPHPPRSEVQPASQDAGPQEAPTPPHGQPQLHQQLAGMQQQLTEITKTQQAAERRANPPLWLKILRNKWLHRLIALIVLILIGNWVLSSIFDDGSDDQTKEQQQRPGTVEERREVQGVDGPRQAIHSIYQFAANASVARQEGQQQSADRIANLACNNIFLPEGARQFAANLGAPDCVQAMQNVKVEDPSDYGRPNLLQLEERPKGNSQRIDSCSFPVTGGPRLGAFTMRLQGSGTWAVAAHEETSCPATPSSAPPS